MRRAEGHVAVAGEVAVDLNRVGQRRQPCCRAAELLGILKDRIDIHGHAIGHDELLHEAAQEELDAELHACPVPAAGMTDLRQEIAGAHDGTGDQVREERDEQEEVSQVALGRHLPPIHVHHVADGLKSVERDAHGQDHAQQRQRRRAARAVQQLLERVEKEIDILEISEQAKVGADADGEQQLPGALGRPRLHAARQEVVEGGAGEDQAGEPAVPARIKDKAGNQQDANLRTRPAQRPVEREDDREENQILLGAEEHWQGSTVRGQSESAQHRPLAAF